MKHENKSHKREKGSICDIVTAALGTVAANLGYFSSVHAGTNSLSHYNGLEQAINMGVGASWHGIDKLLVKRADTRGKKALRMLISHALKIPVWLGATKWYCGDLTKESLAATALTLGAGYALPYLNKYVYRGIKKLSKKKKLIPLAIAAASLIGLLQFGPYQKLSNQATYLAKKPSISAVTNQKKDFPPGVEIRPLNLSAEYLMHVPYLNEILSPAIVYFKDQKYRETKVFQGHLEQAVNNEWNKIYLPRLCAQAKFMYGPEIEETIRKYSLKVDEYFGYAHMIAESKCNWRAVSDAGAVGLGQFTAETAKREGLEVYTLGDFLQQMDYKKEKKKGKTVYVRKSVTRTHEQLEAEYKREGLKVYSVDRFIRDRGYEKKGDEYVREKVTKTPEQIWAGYLAKLRIMPNELTFRQLISVEQRFDFVKIIDIWGKHMEKLQQEYDWEKPQMLANYVASEKWHKKTVRKTKENGKSYIENLPDIMEEYVLNTLVYADIMRNPGRYGFERVDTGGFYEWYTFQKDDTVYGLVNQKFKDREWGEKGEREDTFFLLNPKLVDPKMIRDGEDVRILKKGVSREQVKELVSFY